MAIDGPPMIVNHDDDVYFMRKSLEVAQRALEVGEVPVGCVVVLDKDHPAVVYKKKHQRKDEDGDDNGADLFPKERCGVVGTCSVICSVYRGTPL